MKKNIRLISYLNILYKRRYVSAEEFSELFDVSKRTVFRDINFIEGLGIKILHKPGKGYSIERGLPVSYLQFTERETNAIFEVVERYSEGKEIEVKEECITALDKLVPFIRVSS